MKKSFISITTFLLALVLLISNACTKNYEEMNTDPKIVTADIIDPGLLLTYVQSQAIVIGGSYGNSADGSLSGMCTRGDGSPFGEADMPGMWNFSYTVTLNNLSDIIHIIEKRENRDELVNKTAIARIMKAWSVSRLTDTYGDVPYSESCLPQEQAIYSPKYDSQESIYRDLLKELKEAIAQMDPSKPSFGSADLIYGGDVGKWEKLANSLRLRLALRIRYADPDLARAQLSDLTEADLMSDLGDDAYILNSTEYPEHLNPRYFRIINWGTVSEEVHTHKVMIDILKNDSLNMDPRIKIYADTVKAPFKGGTSPNGYYFPPYKYRGVPSMGTTPIEYRYPWQGTTVSDLSEFWRVPVLAPALMRCSEVYFALAEAKLAGILPASFSGTVQDYYRRGIDASIEWYKWLYNLAAPQIPDLMLKYIHNPAYAPGAQWTQADVDKYLNHKKITDTEVDNFKSTEMYSLSGTEEEQLEKIINQKIVALYPDVFEGWCEYRRTGYPRLPIGPDESLLKGVVPRRNPWPYNERNINSESYNEALARYGGKDNRLVKFWWDKNPNAPHVYQWTPPSMPRAWQ